MPAARKSTRLRTLALASLFVAGLTCVIREVDRRPGEASFRLPDEGALYVRGATFGRGKHRFVEGTTLHQWLSGLPRRALEVTGARVHESDYRPAGRNPEKLILWAAATPAWTDPFERVYLTVADEHGCEFPCSGGASGSGTRPWAFLYYAAPRAGARLKLRAYDRRSWDGPLLGEVEWENPASGVPVPAVVESLPASRRVGELECTLADLEWESEPSPTLWGPPAAGLRAWFRVTWRGRPAPEPRLQEVRLQDAYGSEQSWGTRGRAYGGGGDGVLLAAGRYDLCRRAPWVEVTAKLEDPPPAPAAEVVLPLPPGRAPRPLGASVGKVRFTEIRPGGTPGEWVLTAEGEVAAPFPYRVVDARDERGRPVTQTGVSTTLTTPVRHTIQLRSPAGARELTLSLRPNGREPGTPTEARFVVPLPPF